MPSTTLPRLAREEWFLAVSGLTGLGFVFFGDVLLSGLSNPLWLSGVFAWLFVTVLGSALAVVRHADHLADRLGEPYGTLILTLSVTAIEAASIEAVMLHGANNPTLARDTVFAVMMIVLNGMVGVALLAGGWRHHEQQYNLRGANAYLSVIIPLAVISLVLPDFTRTTSGPTFSTKQEIFLVVMSAGLYAAFLAIQFGRHRGFFALDEPSKNRKDRQRPARPLLLHAALLMAYMVPVVFLAEQLAPPIDYVVDTLHAPAAFGGVVIAVLVASPEAMGATRAALSNEMQRAVNIFLGSVLSTVGLTIPVMVILARFAGLKLVLGLDSANLVMLLLTLFVSAITFTSARTNVIQGLVHLLLFLAYLLLIFQS